MSTSNDLVNVLSRVKFDNNLLLCLKLKIDLFLKKLTSTYYFKFNLLIRPKRGTHVV